ncbi:MAG TPA: CaiB/BaiF CoA-transferase family protein [Steroidobacteraceae bacterium]|jgi:alpha-methylacyl-CoA racemase|nr:CaiB/BaiF CoA-transferase family protein [Steroidobacteraceae bacterium]
MPGPLTGIRIVEMAGIGPGPFAGMMLADHGAEVIRICRPESEWNPADILLRSRQSIVLDIKKPLAADVARRVIASADGLIEGFRPGVMERMGLGPDRLLKDTPHLVYGRMTGWGQTGSLSQAAGHDINYIALAGALAAFGRAGEKPTPPINMVGDFGGGGMLLAFGMVSALLHASKTGEGQVIDCAMTEGASLLMSMIWGFHAAGKWSESRGTNLLDTGAHFYDTYETADGKFISVGAIEPQFYRRLCEGLGIIDADFDAQYERNHWAGLQEKMAAIISRRTRSEWCELLEGTDACVAPVLSMSEAPLHQHNVERRAFLSIQGVTHPAPAPRYSCTITRQPEAAKQPSADTLSVLRGVGYLDAELAELRSSGTILVS